MDEHRTVACAMYAAAFAHTENQDLETFPACVAAPPPPCRRTGAPP